MDYDTLKKHIALFIIYLVISLVFFTARGMAALNYQISGEAGVDKYARRNSDTIHINVTADSNVSFVTGTGSDRKEIPLDCSSKNKGASSGVSCDYTFQPMELNTNIKNLSFTLKQDSGSPQTVRGSLNIDGVAPVPAPEMIVEKSGGGLNFIYSFKDYLSSSSEQGCQGSGIGEIIINVQGKAYPVRAITSQECTVTGNYFVNLSDTYTGTVQYFVIVRDRVGNEYRSETIDISGDFRAPLVQDTFTMERSGMEMDKFSPDAQVTVDVIVWVEDTGVETVTGDLSALNINPAVNIPYKSIAATCAPDSGIYKCVFNGILVKPGSSNLNISITARDNEGNEATQAITKTITLMDDAGQVTYIGPSKAHCTNDLADCFVKSGRQLFYAYIDATSSYNNSIIYLNIGGDKRFAICKLDDNADYLTAMWKCTSVYDVQNTSEYFTVALSESYDDYGNSLESALRRTVTVDDIPPENITALNVTNSNDNLGCAVAGDELTFGITVSEYNPGLKIYMNTSNFTMKDTQYGTCALSSTGDDWDCTLTVKDFTSNSVRANTTILVEDLAGNKLQMPYQMEVCVASSQHVPNVIASVNQRFTPSIDRRTASIIPIKVYIPVELDIQGGAKIMYLSVDSCVSKGLNGMDVMIDSGDYVVPTHGNDGDVITFVLNVGHADAQLLQDNMDINCTISARIRSGSTVYTASEKETILLHAKTFNQPLGTLENTTLAEIEVQKEKLRDIDKSIDKRKDIERILGTICTVSDVMVKVDMVLQVVRAILYALKTAWSWFEGVWNALNPWLMKYDKLVQLYVYPTGSDLNAVVGYLWKFSCFIYNCKIYTLSGLMDIGSYSSAAMAKSTPTTVYNEIDDHEWIVNPYKSKYVDDLCLPAKIYNYKKERQIRCMYVSCLEHSVESGSPTSVCKDVFNVNQCLYLESAQYKLMNKAWSGIMSNMVKQSIMYTMGFAVQSAYNSMCTGSSSNSDKQELIGVLCGLFSAGLKLQEVLKLVVSGESVKDAMFGSRIPEDPASVHDYCEGGELYAE